MIGALSFSDSAMICSSAPLDHLPMSSIGFLDVLITSAARIISVCGATVFRQFHRGVIGCLGILLREISMGILR